MCIIEFRRRKICWLELFAQSLFMFDRKLFFHMCEGSWRRTSLPYPDPYADSTAAWVMSPFCRRSLHAIQNDSGTAATRRHQMRCPLPYSDMTTACVL